MLTGSPTHMQTQSCAGSRSSAPPELSTAGAQHRVCGTDVHSSSCWGQPASLSRSYSQRTWKVSCSRCDGHLKTYSAAQRPHTLQTSNNVVLTAAEFRKNGFTEHTACNRTCSPNYKWDSLAVPTILGHRLSHGKKFPGILCSCC